MAQFLMTLFFANTIQPVVVADSVARGPANIRQHAHISQSIERDTMPEKSTAILTV